MVGSSILPVAYHKGELYFLFGKENPMEDSQKGYSDFGGRVEKGESLEDTAMREGSEEMTGFLGNEKELRKLVQKNGGLYPIHFNDTYHVHIFCIEYDSNLPKYYNYNHAFLWKKMDTKVLNDTKLFEKIEINWFTPSQISSRKTEFREFYREIIDKVLSELPQIKKFICKRNNKYLTKRQYTKKVYTTNTRKNEIV